MSQIQRQSRRFTLRRATARLMRDRRGASAVEFAFVAAPFFALMFAIIETAAVFFASQVLETAVQDSARKIMTGQAQAASFTQSQFKQDVCSRIYGLLDCANGIYVDVRKFTTFGNVTLPKPVDASNNFVSSDFVYQPGGPGDIVVVRLFYLWPVYVSVLGFNLSDVSGGKRLLSASAAFRNEPW